VHLPRQVAPGEAVVVTVDFEGPLVGYTETGMLYVKDRIDPAFTILRTDALAFPSPGVPSVRANRSIPFEDFGFTARVTVPADQAVATGGRLRRRTVDRGTATYEYDGPSVPFLNVAIAPYRIVELAGLRIHALPGDEDKAAALAAAASNALAALERWYGPLAARPEISIIEIPRGFGSQASVTGGILLDAAAFSDRADLPQLYHELSHLWNVEDRDTPSPRWNEGLATYLQYRLAAELDGFTGVPDALKRARQRVCDRVAEGDRIGAVPFAQYGVERMTDWSYRAGLLMFEALEREIGRDRLDAGLRAYVRDHRTSGGTLRELLQTLDAATEVDLGPFFDAWVYSTAWTRAACSG
jgi:hypothetical protein